MDSDESAENITNCRATGEEVMAGKHRLSRRDSGIVRSPVQDVAGSRKPEAREPEAQSPKPKSYSLNVFGAKYAIHVPEWKFASCHIPTIAAPFPEIANTFVSVTPGRMMAP